MGGASGAFAGGPLGALVAGLLGALAGAAAAVVALRDTRGAPPESAALRTGTATAAAEAAGVAGLVAENGALRARLAEAEAALAARSREPVDVGAPSDVVATAKGGASDAAAPASAAEPSGLAALQRLDLRGRELSPQDLAELAALTSVTHVDLRKSSVTDADLAYLSSLDALRTLDLRHSAISGAGLAALPAGLVELDVSNTAVDEASLASLARLSRLEVLDRHDLELGDGVAQSLARLPKLRHVELDGTAVTAAGLWTLLQASPGLTRIEARRTTVTADEAAELALAFPHAEIVVEDPRPGG